MIQTQDLRFSYPGQSPLGFNDIDIAASQHTLILGDSGCGKTTLLQMLSGLRKPSAGSIHINGKNIVELNHAQLDKFRGESIGMIFQTPHFVRALTVKENLALAQSLSGHKKDINRVSAILEALNIGDKLDKLTSALSVGEQQRVAIARALVNQPKVIFADEPTSALDDANTERVVDLLKEQANEYGATLVVVTHDKRLKDNFDNRIML